MPLRKTKKLNKSFGPKIKLNVPDFDRINKHFEALKKEQTGTIKPRQGANQIFNMHKKYDTEGTGMEYPDEGDDEEETKEARGIEHEPSRDYLTQPQQAKKIENPWIDKEVNEEVLDRDKGRPARVMSKNNPGSQPKIRLAYATASTSKISNTDERITGALGLLEEENSIFTTPDLPPTSFLPRFDLQSYEEAEKIPEMISK